MALTWLSFILVISYSVHHLDATTFTVRNNCGRTKYAGINPPLENGGFKLEPNTEKSFPAPPGWSGRIWGRTGCSFDASGRGRCVTGDCDGKLHCTVSGATPATLVEITLGAPDSYDVSLVDGFNIGISITPTPGTGCLKRKCVANLNAECPEPLKQISGGAVVGCKSACAAFNTPEDCCTGPYKNPGSCKPPRYSDYFKTKCPEAYSYAYDDKSSLKTCSAGTDYTITFCQGRP